jgi:hypothetical protein
MTMTGPVAQSISTRRQRDLDGQRDCRPHAAEAAPAQVEGTTSDSGNELNTTPKYALDQAGTLTVE